MFSSFKLDPKSSEPVYRQIALEIRRAILDGRLETGSRLPATRDLAGQLGVNRNTVVAAYDLLATEGVVHSHTGRGTFLAATERDESASRATGPGDDDWMTAFSSAVQGPTLERLLSAYRLTISSEGISFAPRWPLALVEAVKHLFGILGSHLAGRHARRRVGRLIVGGHHVLKDVQIPV